MVFRLLQSVSWFLGIPILGSEMFSRCEITRFSWHLAIRRNPERFRNLHKFGIQAANYVLFSNWCTNGSSTSIREILMEEKSGFCWCFAIW
ncbi:hypothetical protein LOK49_LG01G00522 [Camellia lanceoleosa]|uniref:Uncharacterized protein n=1 Tax=Camellia lanceoleosa TaxID=1840588 RepID=A0ACC0J184_9ERIC|nr:hypothetical protein LOK49_LG01G00522 [Camellia lanceoleosa]